MANYVSWYLHFIEISEEATKKLKEIQLEDFSCLLV